MGKKRKAETSGMEEIEKGLYSSFCAAANSISQLYTQAQNQQRLSFVAGQRHALDQVYQWVSRQRDAGAMQLSSEQLLNFLQRELETGDDAALHFDQQAAAAAAPVPAVNPLPATSFSHQARVMSSSHAQASGQQAGLRGSHGLAPQERSTDFALIDNKAQMYGGLSPQRRGLGPSAGQWGQGTGNDRSRPPTPQNQLGGAATLFLNNHGGAQPGNYVVHQQTSSSNPQGSEQQGDYGNADDDLMM